MSHNIPELNIEFNSLGHTPHDFKDDFIRSLVEIVYSFQSQEPISITCNQPFNIEQSENNDDFVSVDMITNDSTKPDKKTIIIFIYD